MKKAVCLMGFGLQNIAHHGSRENAFDGMTITFTGRADGFEYALLWSLHIGIAPLRRPLLPPR
jgi:hypothetical protein